MSQFKSVSKRHILGRLMQVRSNSPVARRSVESLSGLATVLLSHLCLDANVEVTAGSENRWADNDLSCQIG